MKASFRFAVCLLALSAVAAAQSTASRWSSSRPLSFGRVDRSTLNNHFEIPIYSRATLGHAQIGLRLTYDSNFWSAPGGGTGYWEPGAGFGWRLVEPFGAITTQANETDVYCGYWNDNTEQYDKWWNYFEDDYTFTEPDGTQLSAGLPFNQYLVAGGGQIRSGDEPNDCPLFTRGTQSFTIPDGKGYTFVIFNGNSSIASAEAFDASNDRIDGGFTDPNGNQVTVTANGGDLDYGDPLGPALTQSGSGTPASPLVFAYTGPNGDANAITEKFESIAVTTSFGCGSNYHEWSGTATVPSELDLDDGRKFVFGYDAIARLTSVTLPTGATVNYSYTMDCDSGVTDSGNSSLTRSDSVNGAGHAWGWTRAQQGAGAVETVETDPYGNQGVFDFGAPAWEGEDAPLNTAKFYSGTAGGTELEQVTLSDTLTNGAVSQQSLGVEVFGATPLYKQTVTSFDAFGARLVESDYDWSTTAPGGALLRQSSTAFTVFNGSYDQPQSVVVTDGSNTAQKTTFGYDDRGNLTTLNQYVNAASALTTSTTYFANGNVETVTGPNGGVTTYTDGACGGVFPSQIVGAVAAASKTTLSWNCTGGVLTSSTDANNASTSTTYQDAANTWRPSAVTDPSGATVSLGYPSAAYPNQTVSRMLFNSNNSVAESVATSDGLGRPEFAQRCQDPSCAWFDTVQTTFDFMDRPSTVSMPYTASTPSNAPVGTAVTATLYDALGRAASVTDGGGGVVSYQYNLNDTLTTVAGTPAVERQQEMDGLGRLKSVCEITAGSSNWPAGACGQTQAASGYLTRYTRNALGQITAVSQDAQPGNGGTESRSFSFDELGRMTSESNPETGSTAYTFDTDATCGTSTLDQGNLVKRVDAAGNTTCYLHDAMSRVTQISYPSGPNSSATPSKGFVYDSDTNLALSSVPGYPASNLAGRLVEAYTGPSTGPATITGFAYDATGRADYSAEKVNSGAWVAAAESYYPNGAPATLSPAGIPQITYGLDGEGRPTSVSDGSSKPPVTAASYSALGLTSLTLGSNDSDAYSYDAGTGRMTQYQVSVGGKLDTGSMNWNADGSPASLAVADAIPGNTDNGLSCNYSHDDLGRLLEANCHSIYDEAFSWDAFGNHNSGNTPAGLVTSFSFSGNRIAGGNYDANGNLLQDPLLPQLTNQFDAEGRPVSFSGATAVYDALGREVQTVQSGGSGTYLVMYAPDGSKLGLMNGASAYAIDVPLPGGGAAVYNASGLQYWRHADWLGSAVISSNPDQTLASSTQLTPFGFDETGVGTGYRSFTGAKQWSDALHSGGQYDFMFREYNPEQGRWWTPDPAGLAAVDPSNPQSWNRYAYVNGKPLKSVDRLGLYLVQANGCTWVVTDFYVDGELQGADVVFGGCIIQPPSSIGSGDDNGGGGAGSGGGGGGAGSGGGELISPSPGPPTQASAPRNSFGQTPVHGLWTYGNWCGSGGSGSAINATDADCLAHDACYLQAGFTAGSNFQGSNAKLQACNQQLCNAIDAQRNYLVQSTGVGTTWLPAVPPDDVSKEMNADQDIIIYFKYVIAPWGDSCH